MMKLIINSLLGFSIASFFGCGKSIAEKVQELQAQQKLVGTGVMSHYIDDCRGITPDPAVEIPIVLTTPVAYLTEADLMDPFGKPGEKLFFLPEAYFNNSASFAIISRGPDGDLDSRRLTRQQKYRKILSLPEGSEYQTESRQDWLVVPPIYDSSPPGHKEYQFNVTSYRKANGEVIENPLLSLYMLPEVDQYKRENAEIIADYHAWFMAQGVYPYDPTNGTVSDGDCIAFYW